MQEQTAPTLFERHFEFGPHGEGTHGFCGIFSRGTDGAGTEIFAK